MEVPHIPGQVNRYQDLQLTVIHGGVLRQFTPAGIGNDRHLGKGAESMVQAAQVNIRLAASLFDVSLRFRAQRETYRAAIRRL